MKTRIRSAALAAALTAGSLAWFTSALTAAGSGTASAPPHVLVVMLENQGYPNTLGACSADPYLCSLASSYASDTSWYGVGHPSLPNYLAATTGGTQGCTTDTCFGPFSVTSLGGQLNAAGVPWKAYMESMPSACYTGQWFGGTGSSAQYGEKHNPFVMATDVLSNGCASHVVPFTSFATDLTGSSPPAFAWVTPNQQDDMHSGTVQAGDAWLQANIDPVLSSPWFTAANATVVITMDEYEGNNTNGGGQIPMVVISHNSQGKANVSLAGNHYGLLRTLEEAYHLTLSAAAANPANGDLSTLFGSGSSPTPTPGPTATPKPTPKPTPTPTATPTPTPTPPSASSITCDGATDTTAALQHAVDKGGTIQLPAGTCALYGRITLRVAGTTLRGMGANSTFLVQHARYNIIQIGADNVTVSNLNLNTATFFPGQPPTPKLPVPGVLFSNANNTTVSNVTAEAGSGFGMRFTGPNPCYTYQRGGTYLNNIDMTNTGTGGFAAVDVDCQNNALLIGITIHGGILAMFQDENTNLSGENYTPGPNNRACESPWYITGPAQNITVDSVTSYGGHGIIKGTTANITVTNQVLAGDNNNCP